jgi:hypothetical protein
MHGITVFRETLAAIDNAEAPPLNTGPRDDPSAAMAGRVVGVGSGEVRIGVHDVLPVLRRRTTRSSGQRCALVQLSRWDDNEVESAGVKLIEHHDPEIGGRVSNLVALEFPPTPRFDLWRYHRALVGGKIVFGELDLKRGDLVVLRVGDQ